MPTNKCKCGEMKLRHRVVCEKCWKALPADLRTAFNTAPDVESRRIAVRNILDRCNGTPSFL